MLLAKKSLVLWTKQLFYDFALILNDNHNGITKKMEQRIASCSNKY